MKKDITIKAKKLWWKYGWQLGLVASALGVSWGLGRVCQKNANKVAEEAAKKEEERKRYAQECEERWKAYIADPKNHLGDCGVVTDDFWDEGCDDVVVPNMIVNDVPIEKLGEFGEELMKRAHDGDKHGSIEPEDLAKAIDENAKCSIVVSIYHDEEVKIERVVKRNATEEETTDGNSETV